MEFEEKVYIYATKRLKLIEESLQKKEDEVRELYRSSNLADPEVKAKINMLRTDQLVLTSWKEVFDEYMLAVSRKDTNKMSELESKFLPREMGVIDNFISSTKAKM